MALKGARDHVWPAQMMWAKVLVATAVLALIAASGPNQPPPLVKLWRLDCGQMDFSDFESFSDTHRYDGKPHRLTDSCYLIKHGETYMLWDAGLDGTLEGKERKEALFVERLRERLVPQLARVGVTPAMIRYLGVSHYHADHTGQAKDFPFATLLIGDKDWAGVRARSPEALPVDGLQPWLTDKAKVFPVDGDHDVFADGSVTMLSLPGHTPGHHALLVHLAKAGWILLSGDQFHAEESFREDQVPRFNYDRAETMASTVRFKEIARNLHALVVVQHEPADVAKLPIFPAFAN